MNLYFAENMRLKKVLAILTSLYCVIYGIIIYNRRGAIIASVLMLILFIILQITIYYIVGIRDQRKLNKMLSILYTECNPKSFIERYNEIIDESILNNTTRLNILVHRANAFAYSNHFSEAYNILDKLGVDAIKKSEKASVLSSRITYQMLDYKITNIDEELKELEVLAFANTNKKRAPKKDFKRKYIQLQIHNKILHNKALSTSEIAQLYESIETENNPLNIENNRYYAALFLIQEKDKSGAKEQLEKIDIDRESTIIREKAKALYDKLYN